MRTIASVQLDERRPALLLTRSSKLHVLPVGPRNGLDHDSVVSCDNITTVRINAVGDTIGLFFEDQEPALALAVSDAFDLFLA